MKKIILVAVTAAATLSTLAPQTAFARGHHHRNQRADYRQSDYQQCKRSKGTTGLIAGGAGGALLGNVLGGGTIGTVAGGVGGALLGQHLDKKHDQAQNRRNGC